MIRLLVCKEFYAVFSIVFKRTILFAKYEQL